MGQRGPKPMPRNMRLVTGETRPSRTNEDEPVLPVKIPDPPEHLTDQESDKFIEVAGKLARMRVISEVDADAVAMYAVAWCRMLEADEKIREMGAVVIASKGALSHNPWIAVSNKCRADCKAILSEFGMTPSSRTRVKAT